jgi:hypothetical protein
MLDRYLGRDYIRAELYRVGALSTEYWIPNTTTPEDVLLVLEKISDPAYTNPDLSAEMLDIMTNTSFEDRLPQPLPEGTRVSHKIGYYGTTFADAGIVFPEGARDGIPRRHAGDVPRYLPHPVRARTDGRSRQQGGRIVEDDAAGARVRWPETIHRLIM